MNERMQLVYIIIAGCRKVGSNLAAALSQENHEVVVIDSDPDNFDMLGSGFNGLTVTGMPIDEDVMRSAGIDKADALAAVSNDDNMNVMISQVASRIFHVPRVITRVYDPEREMVFKKMGISTICPTRLAVEKIKEDLISSDPVAHVRFGNTGISFASTKPGKAMIGRQIRQLDLDHVLGLIKDDQFIFSKPDLRIEENDLIVTAHIEVD
jgi:trk system potassium uptake protein